MEYKFHKALHVTPKDNYHLIVEFEDKTVDYDMSSLFERFDVFKELKEDKQLYQSVRIDFNGEALIWNDHIDLSTDGVWEKGLTI